MSLHALLSPETLRRLEDQKRNSTISSVLISLLSVLLIGLCLALMLLPALEVPFNDFTTYVPEGEEEPPPPPPTATRLSSMEPPSAPPMAAPPLIAESLSRISLPRVDSKADVEGLAPGDRNGLGIDGLGPDDGGGGIIPDGIPIHPQRCSKNDRLVRLDKNGGKAEVEESVVKALRWMKQNQSSDGSWGDNNKVGMTGLALLAYLGHCETPTSEEFGESCLSGIVYLLNVGTKNGGKLATNTKDKHWPYEHAIATYALAEAYSFGNVMGYTIPNHKEVLTQAGQWIIEHQHGSGGWDYAYDMSGNRGGDLSVAAWHIQALKACDVTRLEFTGMRPTIKAALAYVSSRQAPSGGFGYTGTAPVGGAGHHSLTGAGVLAYQMWGKGSRSEVRKGVRYILSDAKLDYNGPESDLYAHYYHSQAMMQRGGEQWTQYNNLFRDQILLNQKPNGAWKKPGGRGKPKAVAALFANDSREGIHYRTCLCTLMLEVYYRYLPATH